MTQGMIAVCLCWLCIDVASGQQAPQRIESTVALGSQPLTLPKADSGPPTAGKRVAVTPPKYTGTDVHHMLYLPADWVPSSKHKLPVIVEYSGNYFPASGSTGKAEDSGLGYGLTGGKFIWVNLPFVSDDGKSNAVTWWGDINATIEYARTNIPRICEEFGGDPNAVFLCGFSRGAIATNFIGLHNDEIAKLWTAFITHDHFDGEREWRGKPWGSPLATYRKTSLERLKRLNGRPYLICQAGGTKRIADYLKTVTSLEPFTFVDVNTQKILGKFPNEFAIHSHTDRWLLKDSNERRMVWAWIDRVLAASQK